MSVSLDFVYRVNLFILVYAVREPKRKSALLGNTHGC